MSKLGQKSVHIRTKELETLSSIIHNYDVDEFQILIFMSLLSFFAPFVNSCYFKVATFGDGKYKLTIRKEKNDFYDIKFSINPYGNQCEIYL